MKETTFNFIKYKVGDKIKFDYGRGKVEGTVKFGLYDDAEMFDVLQHLGFFVEGPIGVGMITLPDAIMRYNGVKL